MNKKLTLSINEDLIDAAKDSAAEMGLSLSSLISKLLIETINKNKTNKAKKKYPGLVGELAGIVDMNNPKIKNDDYAQYLLKKHS